MKKLSTIATRALLFIALGITSCSKSSTTPTPTPTPTPTGFTYKVDGGATITVDSANATLYTTGSHREMDVYAFKGGQQVLEFHFTPKTGTQSADPTLGVAALLTYIDSAPNSFDSQSGMINITTCDTTGNSIVGDFNFVGKQYPYTGTTTHTITEGHMVVTKLTHQ
ncbi:MAG: hypothetical protein H0X33_10485 [Taibaiella sp.]|nr:hypothetical protein [Taibaiella sp.]